MAEPIKKIYGGAILKDGSLNDREIRVIASDASVDRVGDIMVPGGCSLGAFKQNPVVLFNHDPGKPVGNAALNVLSDRVGGVVTFAPPRISSIADEVCGLAKAGILNATSIGFNPIESEPLKGGGIRYTKWELLELSIVSVPANPAALIVARSARGAAENEGSAAAPSRRILEPWNPKEHRLRLKLMRDGLVTLEGAEWDAWLALEFPGLDSSEARSAHRKRNDAMRLHDRFMERVRRSDFAKEYRRMAAMTDEEHRAMRMEALAKIEPPREQWKWDPHASQAENMFRLRKFEGQGGRLQ
jgi:HK97 family phage prohead protease